MDNIAGAEMRIGHLEGAAFAGGEAVGRKFSDVFGQLRLPNRLVTSLGSAEVHRIIVNKRHRRMDIHMRHKSVVEEGLLQELREQLRTQFPDMEEIDILMKYSLDDHDLSLKLEKCWDNVLYMIGGHSRLCYLILKKSEWEMTDNLLLIKLRNKSSFILTGKSMDKKIQGYISSRFDEHVMVRFEDGKEASPVLTAPVNVTVERHESTATVIEPKKNDEPRKGEPRAGGGAQAQNTKAAGNYQNGFKNPGSFAGARRKVKYMEDPARGDHKLSQTLEPEEEITVQGVIFSVEKRETKTGRYLITFDMTDGTDSITVKFFMKPSDYGENFDKLLKKGNPVVVKGKAHMDEYAKELVLNALALGPGRQEEGRTDKAVEKRVELHLHTKMSAMDGVTSVAQYIKRAAKWGHKAMAVTDHGVVQAYPEAMSVAKGTGVKILYGVEAYLIDDLGAIVQCPGERAMDGRFVVFDLETTGLKAESDRIIEIGAVRLENGEITARFNTFVDPGIEIPEKITELTGISDEMVEGAPAIEKALADFLEFAGDGAFVAHNAEFDMGFVRQAARQLGLEPGHTVLDTLALSRTLFPELSKHKLNVVAKHLGVSLENHHRAVDDAEATANILLRLIEIMSEKGVATLRDINLLAENGSKSKLPHSHAVIFARNLTGLRNLYELVSNAHINYFYKRPRIPKSEYIKLRDGLLIGTACEAGELFRAVLDGKPDEYIRELVDFYDYLEIQPIGNNMYLYREGKVSSVDELRAINKKIVDLGDKYNKPVVATCDVHFIDPEDEVYRRILMAGEGFKDTDNQAPLFFRTTEEMLSEFTYLGEEKAKEVVIKNTNLIADMIDDIKPIPDGTYAPQIDGAEQMLTDLAMNQAKKIYGDPLPSIVSDRMDRELGSIIKNGFAVMYVIAEKLVSKSMSDGYLVGSRGSVGSSLVATMSGITEVNPLPPHYVCPSCQYSEFDSWEIKEFASGSGYDLPDKKCPQCGGDLGKEGHDIPFETFLGFDGDKEPDIDLNFSGEYQARAHAYTEELFGKGYVFKAGTIASLADKTAYGYVLKYMEERGLKARGAEINRLKTGCTGVRKSTGQHPGGLVVVPSGHSIYEFCPIQRPANDTSSNVITTHFDYEAIKGRLLKLDILGHDVPTIIRMLHDITGVDPLTVSLSDPKVMSLFTSPEALGVTAAELNCGTGTLGLPEFGTGFVRQMLLDTQPKVFSDLVRISGLSHGTDVWLNNAQDLIRDNVASLREIIPGRDDIMVYLINKGVDKLAAFKIMEDVRKGKGVKEEQAAIMEEADVPDWYIESCQKIKYLFPKGHAVAYVTMTVRIGYYKVYYPYAFYAASFSVKAEDFDYEVMCQGMEPAREALTAIAERGRDATAKEKGSQAILELVMEMYVRGLKFVPLDLYRADVRRFLVTDDGLMPPLCSVQGLGVSVAQNIVDSRREGEFMTVQDFRERTKTNKTVIELLKKHGILKGIPETDQLCLF